MSLHSWINGDETANQMLTRVLKERPFLLLPPLHRVPLRVGNIVEIVGSSASAKTEILIQSAINCLLPKEWNGVHYGGLERLVIYFDLDCRFDVERLSQSLRCHILEANGKFGLELNKCVQNHDMMDTSVSDIDEELFMSCMRRFLYVRCYSSFEFLATLKTLHYRLQKESEINGVCAHFLMIDSISAFYWADRASTPLPLAADKRKSFSFHSMVETIVQEIQKLLQVQPMLLFATKATIFGDGSFTSELKRKWTSQDNSNLKTSRGSQHPYREYMPSIWQLFITHRVYLQDTGEDHHDTKTQNKPIYASEWLLPSLCFTDKFLISNSGIYLVQ